MQGRPPGKNLSGLISTGIETIELIEEGVSDG
jgi:hypothetical protein